MSSLFRRTVDRMERTWPAWIFRPVFLMYAAPKICCMLLFSSGYIRSVLSWLPVDGKGRSVPWFSYPALAYLRTLDLSDTSVLEFGAGYSTLYWERHAASVTSVESDAAWVKELSAKMKDPSGLCLAQTKEAYLKAGEETKKWDMVVIDGLYRTDCAKVAPDYLKKGGCVILDDAERHPGAVKVLTQAGLVQIGFTGFAPIINYRKTTSFFLDRSLHSA